MATFPTLTPASRSFTPGRYPHSEIRTLDGLQARVRTSNVILEQRLRLTFVALTEAQMLSIRSHYNGQQGRFLSFDIPTSLLSGMAAPASFTPTGYSWIYAGPPQVEDIGLQRYTVSVEIVTVPPEGSNVNGAEFDVTVSISAGSVSTTAQVAGASMTVAASIEGGAVADNTSGGFDLTVPVSFVAGTATGEAGGAADPNFASVPLLLHMDGSNGSTTFTDASSNAHTITVYGNAQVTTTSPKFGTGALLCDGSGDSLSAPSNTSLTFGVSGFTIESWVRVNSFGARQFIFSQRDIGGFSLEITADGRLNGITPNINTLTQASATMAINTWYHVAYTRLGNTHTLWLNGSSVATNTFSENGLSGISYIGSRDGSTSSVNGRLDDLRITKNVARYTANFTPPTAAFPDTQAAEPATDPNFSSVSLLLHMDGSNGSTTFTDASSIGHTITVGENAQVTTTLPKYGTGALLCDGSGDYLSVPSSTSLTFGTGDFTIEAWVRFNTVSANQYIFSQRNTSGFSLILLSDGRLQGITPNLNSITEGTASMVVNTWYHVAFTRSGTTNTIWINGGNRGTLTNSENGLSGISYVGAGTVGSASVLNGRIDDLRVTKGVCRYTAGFTPRTSAFPDA